MARKKRRGPSKGKAHQRCPCCFSPHGRASHKVTAYQKGGSGDFNFEDWWYRGPHTPTPEMFANTRLPPELGSLPEEVQGGLRDLLARFPEARWFSGQGGPSFAKILGREHLNRLQRFWPEQVKAPSVNILNASLEQIHRKFESDEILHKIAFEAAEEAKKKGPSEPEEIGRKAWEAILRHASTTRRHVPWNAARKVVEHVGDVGETIREKTAIRIGAREAARSVPGFIARKGARLALQSIANEQGRRRPSLLFPGVAANITRDFARPVVGPIAVNDAAEAASDAALALLVQDVLKIPNPFTPHFALFQMGMYPLLLANGDYLIVHPK